VWKASAFVSVSQLHPRLTFERQSGAEPCSDRSLLLVALSCKWLCLRVTNTLAYFTKVLVYKKRMFISLDLFVCFCRMLKEFFGNRLWRNSYGSFWLLQKYTCFKNKQLTAAYFQFTVSRLSWCAYICTLF
jgi:hypothetical protein